MIPSVAYRSIFGRLPIAFTALALFFSSAASAQIPDLHLRGNLPGQLTEFGVGMRDAIRKKLGDCTQPVGGILVCGHRQQYRIDRNVFASERGKGSGSQYDRYLEAKEHSRETGQD